MHVYTYRKERARARAGLRESKQERERLCVCEGEMCVREIASMCGRIRIFVRALCSCSGRPPQPLHRSLSELQESFHIYWSLFVYIYRALIQNSSHTARIQVSFHIYIYASIQVCIYGYIWVSFHIYWSVFRYIYIGLLYRALLILRGPFSHIYVCIYIGLYICIYIGLLYETLLILHALFIYIYAYMQVSIHAYTQVSLNLYLSLLILHALFIDSYAYIQVSMHIYRSFSICTCLFSYCTHHGVCACRSTLATTQVSFTGLIYADKAHTYRSHIFLLQVSYILVSACADALQ